jgi:hypothetical protein
LRADRIQCRQNTEVDYHRAHRHHWHIARISNEIKPRLARTAIRELKAGALIQIDFAGKSRNLLVAAK